MSQAELQRLSSDLDGNPTLAGEFWDLADVAARTQWAVGRNYDVTVEEVGTLAEGELSEEDLEMVAGGWDGTDPNGGG